MTVCVGRWKDSIRTYFDGGICVNKVVLNCWVFPILLESQGWGS